MPLVQRSEATRWQESRAEAAAPSGGMSEIGSVVSASPRPAPIRITAQSCPIRGPTSTSSRTPLSRGAITRSNSPAPSLPRAGISVEGRPIGDRVQEQPLGVAPEQAEGHRAFDQDHVAVAVRLVHGEGRAPKAPLGLGPAPARELERPTLLSVGNPAASSRHTRVPPRATQLLSPAMPPSPIAAARPAALPSGITTTL